MPVELPRLKRIQPDAPESVGRLNVQAPDLERATAPMREGVNALGKSVINAIETNDAYNNEIRKQEIAAKDLKATELALRYEAKNKEALSAIGLKKGDVTPDYKTFDESQAQWKNEFVKDIDDPELMAMYERKVQRTNTRLSEARNIQQAKQFYSYQEDVINNTVKLRQDDAAQSSQILDAKNPNTFAPFRARIDEIVQARVAQADQNGLITERNEDGSAKSWGPAVETKIREDVGGAVIPAVKTLNAAGKAAEAKKLIEDYKQWMNADDIAKLSKENDEASIKNQALAGLAKLGANPTIDQINSQPDLSEEVKFKMREINNTNSIHRERERKGKADKAISSEVQRILARQAGNKPYATAAEYRDSPEFKNASQYMTPSNIRSLERMITTPSESDPEAYEEYWKAFQKDQLGLWSYEKVIDVKSRLSGRDRTAFDQAIRDSSKPFTESGKRAAIGTMGEEVDRLSANIKDPDGNPAFKKNQRTGKYGRDDLSLINDVKTKVTNMIAENPRMTTKEINEVTNRELNNAVKQKYEDERNSIGGQIRGFFRGLNPFGGSAAAPAVSTLRTPRQAEQPVKGNLEPTKTPQTPTQGGSEKVDKPSGTDMSGWTTSTWRKDFEQANGRAVKDVAELKAWKDKRLGR